MAKFSFPLPGRKHTTPAKEKDLRGKSSSGTSNKSKTSNLSKAQRILGTDNNLNIDSPTHDDHSWGYPSSRSSGMSISISESTQSTSITNDTGSVSGSNADQWERESGVFPKAPRLRGKASSTVLGQHYGEDEATDTSSLSRRMRHEGSDSTLKSYYDRQKSPLSISQQTSASSARDLALRKGFPPVIPRSPLLQVDSINDPFDQQFAEPNHNEALSRDKSMRKKPARLDLSMLFPKSRKNGVEVMSPSSISTNASMARNPTSGRRKLTKAPSKESLQSQKHSIRSPPSGTSKDRPASTSDTLHGLYDNYEHLPVRSPHMSQIPESRVPDRETQPRKNEYSTHPQPDPKSSRQLPRSNRESPSQSEHSKINNSHLSPTEGQTFSWKNVRSNMTNPPWEISSSASISSHNTKTSRHTSVSVFSNSDLKQSSVLSLSSDSEGDDSDQEPKMSSSPTYDDKASRMINGSSKQMLDSRCQSTQKPQVHASVSRKQGSRKGAAKTSPFLTIPEASFPSSRISGPWSPPDLENHRSPISSQALDRREKRTSKKPPSVSSKKSSQHPTPPTSPNSAEFKEVRERSGRYMAVTKQEEALLEALRQKRARMREKIIEEHETAKTPPRVPNRTTSRYSEASSVSTLRGPDNPHKEQILLYLDTPISDTHAIDTAEPSPDLSDFLSFGSDEDSTPRTSWAVPRKDKPRPDSSIRKSEKISPMTPPSAARLSAVGTVNFRESRSESKRRAPAVRFVDEGRMMNAVNPPDFLMDENESDVIWGM